MTTLPIEKARFSTLPKKIVCILVQSRTSPCLVRWAFLLFVFTIPFEAVDLGAISRVASPTRLAGLLFFGICLLYPKVCFRRPPQALWWFAGYATVLGLSGLLISESFVDEFIKRFLTIIQLLILCWIGSTLLQEEKFARATLLAFSIGILLAATGMLLGLPGFSAVAKGRLTMEGLNANAVALIMALGAHALIGLGFGIEQTFRHIWMRVACLAMSLIPLMAMVYTGTRSGILAFLAGAMIYVLPYGGSKRKMATILGATIAVICVVYIIVNDQKTFARFEKSYETGHSSGRHKIYGASIEMISEKPLLGWGPVVLRHELGSRNVARHKTVDSHNLFLFLLSEVGLLGTIPFLIGFGLCMRAAWTARISSLGLFPLVWFVTMTFAAMALTILAHKVLWIVLIVSLASEASIVKQRKRKKLMIRTILQHSPKRVLPYYRNRHMKLEVDNYT